MENAIGRSFQQTWPDQLINHSDSAGIIDSKSDTGFDSVEFEKTSDPSGTVVGGSERTTKPL
jgi:hypothetical protein